MYPQGHKKGPVLQGMPVAIGTERRSVYVNDDMDTSTSSGSRSGGSSPESYETVRTFRDERRHRGTGRALQYGRR